MRSGPSVGRCVLRLALAELEALASLRTARLLALDRTRIAREQAEIAELAAVRFVDDEQRAGGGEAKRPGLTRHAATLDLRLHVEAAQRIGCTERLLDRGDQRGAREVVTERATVHFPLARTGREVQT